MSSFDSEVHYVFERLPFLGQGGYLVHEMLVLRHQVDEQTMILLACRVVKEFELGGGHVVGRPLEYEWRSGTRSAGCLTWAFDVCPGQLQACPGRQSSDLASTS